MANQLLPTTGSRLTNRLHIVSRDDYQRRVLVEILRIVTRNLDHEIGSGPRRRWKVADNSPELSVSMKVPTLGDL